MLALHGFARTTAKGVSARVISTSNGDTYESPQLQGLELRFASLTGFWRTWRRGRRMEDIEKERGPGTRGRDHREEGVP